MQRKKLCIFCAFVFKNIFAQKIFTAMQQINHKFFFFLFIILFLFSCGEEKKNENKTSATDKTTTPADALTEKIKNDTNNASLYYQRSKWNLSLKKIAAAENDIHKALSIDSSKAEFYMQLADVDFTNMHVQDAEDAFKKSVTIDKNNIDGYLKLAELYLYVKKYEESIKNANEALRIDKHRAKAYFIKGYVYKENKDTSRAISSFQTALEQEPTYYDAIIQLGNLYATHNDPLALQYYNSALKLQPHSIEAMYNRGLFFQNTGSIDKAVNDYNELLKIDPGYGFAYFNLGFIAMKYDKDYQKAINLFTNALTHESHYVEAYYNRAVCYENIGNKQKAKADYLEALTIFPTYKLALDAMKQLK